MKALALLLLVSCSPTLYTTASGIVVHDSWRLSDAKTVDCVAEVAYAAWPMAPQDVFQGLDLILDNEVVLCGLILAGGCYHCTMGVTSVSVLRSCAGDSALVHEFMHHLKERVDGTCDPLHEDSKTWAPTGIEGQLRAAAKELCCS